MPTFGGIHRHEKRAKIDLDEEIKIIKIKMEVTVMMDQTLMRRTIIFSHKTTMPLTKRIRMIIWSCLKLGMGTCHRRYGESLNKRSL